MQDAYIGGRFWQTKITCKASDVAENLQLYRVVQFFHPRSSYTMTHISADVHRITLNVSCMSILGGRTKQLHIFCHITGFTGDFLSFIVVEYIRFFHRVLQLHAYETLWFANKAFLNLLVHPYLHHVTDFVANTVQIWTVGSPNSRWHEVRSFLCSIWTVSWAMHNIITMSLTVMNI